MSSSHDFVLAYADWNVSCESRLSLHAETRIKIPNDLVFFKVFIEKLCLVWSAVMKKKYETHSNLYTKNHCSKSVIGSGKKIGSTFGGQLWITLKGEKSRKEWMKNLESRRKWNFFRASASMHAPLRLNNQLSASNHF